jgi:hypothetical protein
MRIGLSPEGQPKPPKNFSEAFKPENIWKVDINPRCNPRIVHDLEVLPWPLPLDCFDEIHAYEVLEHLGQLGDYKFFFALWRQLWHLLKPKGIVAASTPWWQSVWAWQDPGHRRVYSPELLVYLNQDEYVKQVGRTSITDYRAEWPAPYDFKCRYFEMTGDKEGVKCDNPLTAGFSFVVQKEEWSEDRD